MLSLLSLVSLLLVAIAHSARPTNVVSNTGYQLPTAIIDDPQGNREYPGFFILNAGTSGESYISRAGEHTLSVPQTWVNLTGVSNALDIDVGTAANGDYVLVVANPRGQSVAVDLQSTKVYPVCTAFNQITSLYVYGSQLYVSNNNGNVLYSCDYNNSTNNNYKTILSLPNGYNIINIAFDSANNLYIASHNSSVTTPLTSDTIWKVSPGGQPTVWHVTAQGTALSKIYVDDNDVLLFAETASWQSGVPSTVYAYDSQRNLKGQSQPINGYVFSIVHSRPDAFGRSGLYAALYQAQTVVPFIVN